jgi:uncharacterized 2Fe-2S/4Fe-4S cluster protein (DUF4445 family)
MPPSAPELILRLKGRTLVLPLPERDAQSSLLRAVYLSGRVRALSLCAGLGRCGRCRMRFLPESPFIPPPLPEDTLILGEGPVRDGWRLACRHKVQPGARLLLPDDARPLEPENPRRDTGPEAVSLAVDFGTTSLCWAVNPEKSFAAPNPQMGAGADIVSRIAYAGEPGGLRRLARLSRAALARIVEETPGGVREICLAANPAMTCIALGRNVQGLAGAPYRLDYQGGCRENPPGLPPLWTAPLIAPFIGGDLSAGYARLALADGKKAEFPFMLADMGTNGEFILALTPDKSLAASLPLGPALEGMGMRCGSVAAPGVITDFTLAPDGLKPQGLAGPEPEETAPGIAGSGYIALVRRLLRLGLIREDGLFDSRPGASPLARHTAARLHELKGEKVWRLPDSPLYLASTDVEELLKIKAAFSLALKLLLREAGLGFSALKKLYLAGALGAHVPAESLEELGFIPPGGSALAEAAGNTALQGALLLCRQPELRPGMRAWATRVRTLSLTESPDFQQLYLREMRFAWI